MHLPGLDFQLGTDISCCAKSRTASRSTRLRRVPPRSTARIHFRRTCGRAWGQWA
jgi:hypothetical protein